MPQRNIQIEEFPLNNFHNYQKKSEEKRNCKGPLRVLKLCVLGILLPCILIAVPLYMRFKVYGHQLYPLAISDMRILDNKVSTTWCQRQLVRVNTTFNAFLLSQPPTLSKDLQPLSMVRHLVLEDDTKEYWGFYLLRGSSVTVSTCVRWPGASLIVIKGHKHLHQCAYIGDDSSEELDEIMEAIAEGTYVAPNIQVINTNKRNISIPNAPNMMKRHRSDVEFRDPTQKSGSGGHTIEAKESRDDSQEITDNKSLEEILNALQKKNKPPLRKNKKIMSDDDFKDYMMLPRNKTIAKDEGKNIVISPPLPVHSILGYDSGASNKGEITDEMTSEEIYLNILKKLRNLGEKGDRILEKLSNSSEDFKHLAKTSDEVLINMKGRHYHKPVVKYDDNIDKNRKKRDIILETITEAEFNDEDIEDYDQIDHTFTPDGIADHRGTLNESTLNDRSDSEFWSSFSSSEEALLNCSGLILNLPLTPHHRCTTDLSEDEAEETYLANTVTYRVPSNGYYFFVFNSENEIQPNYIRVHFHLEKTVYNVSNPVANCSVTNNTCAMDLKFFSSEKVVMEIPVRENKSLWNEEYVVISECEPRTAVYAICVIAVPVLFIMFAFT